MTREQLFQLRSRKVKPGERVEIADVRLDPAMPAARRAEEYFEQIQNPYAFQCGKIAVNVRFSTNGKSLADALAACLWAAKDDAEKT